jgi:hypothetical protein
VSGSGLQAIAELLDAPDDVAGLATGLEREVLWRLVTGPEGAAMRQIALCAKRPCSAQLAPRHARRSTQRPAVRSR